MKTINELETDTPWWTTDYDDLDEGYRVACHRDGYLDGSVTLDGVYSKQTANLISAAPEMYDAAERLLRFENESIILGDRSFEEVLADIKKARSDLRAALAKAAGETYWTD